VSSYLFPCFGYPLRTNSDFTLLILKENIISSPCKGSADLGKQTIITLPHIKSGGGAWNICWAATWGRRWFTGRVLASESENAVLAGRLEEWREKELEG